jgi:hypothetical protein
MTTVCLSIEGMFGRQSQRFADGASGGTGLCHEGSD